MLLSAAFIPADTAPEPLWRLAENALVNLVEAPPTAPALVPTRAVDAQHGWYRARAAAVAQLHLELLRVERALHVANDL